MIHFDVFDARDLLFRRDSSFPPGANSSDTVIGNVHFNTTALGNNNYTFYPGNNTLSNASNCYMVFAPYTPVLVQANGSFVNATTCYSSVNPIGKRGYVGIALGVLYGLAIVLTLVALAKHGALYLRATRRFYPIGRRWQWYWACLVSACAIISLFSGVEIERYYLQDLPIILCVFFWFLMCMGTAALVWESVRHWGSWLERQYVDPNPFVYREDDGRAKVEFWLPLWFYFWFWMNFFMVVPRSWNFARSQHSVEQTRAVAIPTATSVRFKVGAFCLVVCWLTIMFSLTHSIRYYRPRHRGIFGRAYGLVQAVPLRFVLTIPLVLALIAYQTVISFIWDFSLVKEDGSVPIIMAWGYGPSLLIIYIQIVYAYATPNEDKELIRQRRERGETVDRELGVVHKPAWWRRVRGEHLRTMRDKINQNVNEVGERGIGRRVENDAERDVRLEAERSAINGDTFELSSLRDNPHNPRVDRAGVHILGTTTSVTDDPLANPYMGKDSRRHAERLMQSAGTVLFPSQELAMERARRATELMEDGPPPPYQDRQRRESETQRPSSAHRSNSTSTTLSVSAEPQRVRSMLDV
ncbi:uncharacterized protein MAM_04534 [Metarhizium album ARSEF 1941]|uniref:Uncharacterized protein n=1 Tax=Metarhizium album (strain ARSEF 1941) TaxID=1081103 RepID=A0A0B2WV48_METAS|nr:uncharacterized protein MAM_04534 [Metarhizium album ARSEF 1941]KHN97519.1 hypothetical protein MAM_04534 [Metarhizium album ARSEF 1941]